MRASSPLSRDSIRRNLLLGFGLVLALLSILPFIVLSNTASFRLLADQMSASYRVLGATDRIGLLIAEADREIFPPNGRGSAGKKRTGNRVLRSELQKELAVLQKGTADSPDQLTRAHRLQSLVHENLEAPNHAASG